MSLANVNAGLINKLVTAFPLWTTRIAWENMTFIPTNEPWMAYFFMPASEQQATLGPDGFDQSDGISQVDLNYPLLKGEQSSRETIELLRTCFLPIRFQYSGTSITILSRSRAVGRTVDGWFKIPFTIRWRAYLNR